MKSKSRDLKMDGNDKYLNLWELNNGKKHNFCSLYIPQQHLLLQGEMRFHHGDSGLKISVICLKTQKNLGNLITGNNLKIFSLHQLVYENKTLILSIGDNHCFELFDLELFLRESRTGKFSFLYNQKSQSNLYIIEHKRQIRFKSKIIFYLLLESKIL
jgi:hypothetical protein